MKQVTKTVTTRTVTGGEQSSRSSRAASPSRLSRIEEKDQLTKLNDRLAAYIDHIRSLESENERLTTQIQTYEETTQRDRANFANLYEDELAAARKLLDEMGRDNAKLSVDVGTYKAEAEEWMRKYNTKDRELSQLQKKFNDLEKLLPDLECKLNAANKDKERWQLEYGKLKSEMRELERQLASARKQLEEETLLKVDLENKVQSLKEELSFKAQLHQSELNETRTRMEISIEEVDSRTQREVESRLQEALSDFRSQHEHEMRLYREEITSLYESKIRGLQKELDGQGGLDEKARIEINMYKSRNSELQAQIAKLTNQNGALEARIASLEADLASERDQSRAMYEANQLELRRLRGQLNDQMREYQDLLDIKVSLDLEIAAYRKLLEGEEERLNISGSEVKATPKKRKRDNASASFVQETEASSGFNTSCRSTGALQIIDVSEKGDFVQLKNDSTQEISMKAYKIVHKAGDQETDYKFHRATKLPAGETLSIWSMDAGQVADTANHVYVMKGRWVIGDSMVTSVLDKDGNEVAACEMTKSVQRTTLKARRTEEAFHQRGDPEGKQNCSVM